MAVDLDNVFAAGGQDLVDVLNYCARSVQMDPVFAFLVHDYRLLPNPGKAIALYDTFIAPGAPARLDASDLLPPRDLSLAKQIETLRRSRTPVTPGKWIFDALDQHVRNNRRGAIARIKRRYNFKLTPTENLPGKKMTASQRQFVDQVWQPRIRPVLVSAGFRRIANIA